MQGLQEGTEQGISGGQYSSDASGLSAAAEEKGRGSDSVDLPIPETESSASSPSAEKEESDGLATDDLSSGSDVASGVARKPAKANSPDKSTSAFRDNTADDSQLYSIHGADVLTHEQRVAIAQQIKDTEWNRQWIAGDTGNAWIAELGEEAEQYLSDFGYVHESLANILRVCAAIPPPYRNGNLRYSHHVVVYQLPREDQVLRLKECEDEGWSVAEFRRQVHGEAQPRIKRWPMSELLEGLEAWPHPADRPRPKGAVRAYLEWLGEQA